MSPPNPRFLILFLVLMGVKTIDGWILRTSSAETNTARCRVAIRTSVAIPPESITKPFTVRHLRRRSAHSTCFYSNHANENENAHSDNEPSSRKRPQRQLYLYNSKTRQKELQQLLRDNNKPVSMYTCGPTVYDSAHVGNFRAFLTYDVLKRVLLYFNYKVKHVINLTDIDDKIINRANELGLDNIQDLTRKYERLFLQDADRLNLLRACVYPRATEHVREMMHMIDVLADKKLAYETADGSWYFNTQQQAGYGQQLVQLDFNNDDKKNTGSMDRRSDDEDAEETSPKRHAADFCLWKAFKAGHDRDDACWSSSTIQKGRPGWHLECSAMALKHFDGQTLDFHGGGADLKFPHHENEIAQYQGATGTTFCNCWFHNGFVNMQDDVKMSKSLGNFVTLRDACPTRLNVRAYRYLVVSSQYRNPLAFTQEAMMASKNAIKRLDKVKSEMERVVSETAAATELLSESELALTVIPDALETFEAAICDDMSMPRAAAALFTLVKEAEKELKRIVKDDKAVADVVGLKAILDAMEQMDQVFGIFYEVPLGEDEEENVNSNQSAVPSEVVDLVLQRSAAKDSKDWALADSLRARITELGFAVKDVKGGEPIVSRVEAE